MRSIAAGVFALNSLCADNAEGARKAKLANDLLGRSGSELMPLFNQNIEIFQKQREEYKKLGIAISDDVIDAGNQFGDSMEKLKSIGAGYGAMIGGQLLPIINQLTGALINELPKIREALTPVFEGLTNSVKFLIENNYIKRLYYVRM